MAVLDIVLNGVFTGLGTGIGVIVAELWLRDRFVNNKKKFDERIKNIKSQLFFPDKEGG